MAGTTANDRLVRDFLKAWEQRDTEFIVGCFTDDAVYQSLPLPPISGKAAIREFVASFQDAPPGRLTVHHQLASGDVVMNERTDNLTMNGRPVHMRVCGVFEFSEGRIKAWREYFDMTPVGPVYAPT